MEEAVKVEVRKHRAPKGALRPVENGAGEFRLDEFREYRAPKGALRQIAILTPPLHVICGQKAPSAIRRIKTGQSWNAAP